MRTSRGWWSISGVVAGAVGLALSYLAAGLLHVRDSPVVAVAEGIIKLTPGAVVEWAIQTFQHNDKTVFAVGLFVVLSAVFALIGQQARKRWWLAVGAYLALAAVGAVAIIAKPGTPGTEMVPVVVGLIGWLVAMAVLAEWLRRWELVEASKEPSDEPTHSRRWFFTAVGATGAVAAGGWVLGRFAGSGRRRVEESRRLLRLDQVTDAPPPRGVEVGVDGVAPWRTPAQDFYLIDTAFTKPTIEPKDWRLRIHGAVDREITLTYEDLVSREITQDWITLNCVSNPVGGNLIGNAWWSGVRLAAILAEAGPQDGADAVLQTSDDGWTCATPLAALTDDRNAMLAVAMNGEPLPVEHGFPVRTIVPGLYGYVSACKWVVDMQVTRFDDVTAYWTSKGWSEQGPVKMSSRIDVPGSGSKVDAGTVVFAGAAWSQHTGIETVEVSVDGATWATADLARTPNDDTWVQWRVEIDVAEGEHQAKVRARDKDGQLQTGVIRDVLPDGSTGWHTIGFTAS
ncbi:MAG TPA: molybdopterin-dependent oxidoreductase [Nocardioides sp.]|nr:molybdopterin-dependent oxidoreductase [Nocardioides sp.]